MVLFPVLFDVFVHPHIALPGSTYNLKCLNRMNGDFPFSSVYLLWVATYPYVVA